jgi:hypothetical protein
MKSETHFTAFWRELSAALSAESETPATAYEAAACYREPLTSLDGMVREILRYRIAAALMKRAA